MKLVEETPDVAREAAVLAGPYTIKANTPILPGYTVKFELWLGNLTSECTCRPTVEIATSPAEPDTRPVPLANGLSPA
jgi:hypothetical protein